MEALLKATMALLCRALVFALRGLMCCFCLVNDLEYEVMAHCSQHNHFKSISSVSFTDYAFSTFCTEVMGLTNADGFMLGYLAF